MQPGRLLRLQVRICNCVITGLLLLYLLADMSGLHFHRKCTGCLPSWSRLNIVLHHGFTDLQLCYVLLQCFDGLPVTYHIVLCLWLRCVGAVCILFGLVCSVRSLELTAQPQLLLRRRSSSVSSCQRQKLTGLQQLISLHISFQ